MKKMLLMSLMTISIFGFARSIEQDVKPTGKSIESIFAYCAINITFYNSSGHVIDFVIHSSDQPTLGDCKVFQNYWINYYTSRGYKITYPGQINTSL